MTFHLLLYVLVAVICLGVSSYIRIRKSPAYHQRTDQIVIRQPGQRLLGSPEPIAVTGNEDLPFALLSQAAYQRKPDAKAENAGACVEPDTILGQMGWNMWPDFGGEKLQEKIRRVHLRVEVWWHIEHRKVAVAFGGTVFTNIKDWRANLRWFLPRHQDEYTVIVTSLGGAFVAEFLDRIRDAGWNPQDVHLFSTGHSLGGGLAQEFAYSLPVDESVPRIQKVYAFDPSPVTGFYSVPKRLREHNVMGLFTDRIYERGEILAIVRSLTNFIYPPSSAHPTIRQIRYNLFPTDNPVAGHSIAELACRLYQAMRHAAETTVTGIAFVTKN